MDRVRVTELSWSDEPIGEVPFPAKMLVLRHGLGSGLAHDPREDGTFWAVADRGPNVEIDTAVDDYGWVPPPGERPASDTKIMPRLDLGPYLGKLRLTENSAIELVEIVRLSTADGEPVPGLPPPDRGHAQCEPAYDLDGRRIEPDVRGMDTEGIAALADGSFWLSEEYGPSLIEVDRSGQVRRRFVPAGSAIAAASETFDSLPAIAARRHLNRGFEAVTVAPGQDALFVAFQSPLAHPDKAAFQRARHVRIWELDRDARVTAQYLYPLDEPKTFVRDARAKPDLKWKDLKICELSALSGRGLLVLERSLETCKIYRVELDPALRLPDEHLDLATSPTAEQLSAGEDFPLPQLDKTLLFTSDDYPEVGPDMEGMTLISANSVLLVSDNDFGVLDKRTRFYRLDFPQRLTSPM